MRSYDLAVIGGGPAGYSAAFEAVRHRMRTVIFEKDWVGGTCLNRGCVPTKYLSHTARKFYEAKNASDGICIGSIAMDYRRAMDKMSHIITAQREALEGELARLGVEMVCGEVCVKDAHKVCCDGKDYQAKNILIATGSQPARPLIREALTSDQMLRLDHIPKRLHILGGGTIAAEFASIYQMLGSRVTIYIRGDRILRKWDKEIGVSLTQSFKRKGIEIRKGCDFSGLSFEEGTVLSAGGRVPLLPALEGNLFVIGSDGGILTDRDGQTKTSHIYAAGDVIHKSLFLAHTAMEQGRRAVRRMAGIENPEPSAVVRCIYVDQEIASVGITEAEDKEAICAKQNMYSNPRTMISTSERGFVKLLGDKATHRILGGQMMCERAGDMVSELALAIDKKLTVEDMLMTVRPHPSFTEAVSDALRALEDKLNAV